MNVVPGMIMLCVPPLFALTIHNYLRHGQLTGRRKALFYAVYFLLINLITMGVSCLRGVRGLRFADMTMTYKAKYTGLGIICGFVMPFPICLMAEDIITLAGVRRYSRQLIGDVRKYFPYAVRSAKADLNSEVSGSYLNWLWWLIEPFCMMLIYTLIFGVVFKASEPYFPIFIFIGISMWSFFSRSVSGSVNTVRDNKGIITKVYMPKYILLLSRMLVNGFKMLVAFGIVAVMMVAFRVAPTVNILCAALILPVLFLFTFGVGTILMHYGVYVSDLGYITGIVLQMMMYFTGTFYSIARRVPEPFGEMIESCNPVAFLIAAMRGALLYGQMPSLALLAVWGFLSLILIALGVFTIYSNENAYVKVI
ncbi:MAG: ABC transporter permease [Roseburia sp.]|nr:ABC transporter permease [Roseburia sp.]